VSIAPLYRDGPDGLVAPIYDAIASIQDWGRYGIVLGANFGIILGVIFVAIPFTAPIHTLGVFGTLFVGAVACALMAGGFAVVAGALYRKTRYHVRAFVRVRPL